MTSLAQPTHLSEIFIDFVKSEHPIFQILGLSRSDFHL